ncbi:MAG: hypothetical protein JWN37_408 [Candidatus Nomurabacteria bacterium]|nr:hypothetical protein [Candidatus Nomurabacteria bacterium]
MGNLYENGKVKINAQSLVLIIQAVDSEIQRLKRTPTDEMVLEDYQFLEDYINVAEELEEIYKEAQKEVMNLPVYDRLVDKKPKSA